MKNLVKLFGITAIIAVIVFGAASCASMTVVGIDSESVTGPRQVRQYGTINQNDVTVYAFFKDDSRKTVSNKTIVNFDSTRVGPQTVTVRITGGFTATFQTEVMALNGITVTAQPNPNTLKLGAAVSSWPGLQIQGAWNGMSNANINASECQITGYDPNRAGRQTLTVSYQGKTATFNVNVVDVQSIRIASAPTKLTYYQGDSLALTGLSVIGTWPGLSEEAVSITSSNITGYNPQTLGRQTVTVTYRGKTATFSVEVLERPDPALNGTWIFTPTPGFSTGFVYTFNDGTYQRSIQVNSQDALNNPQVAVVGTYTTSGGKITNMTTTHMSGEAMNPLVKPFEFEPTRFYTRDEVAAVADIPQTTKDIILSFFRMVNTMDYSINGNALVIVMGSQTQIYTKR